MMSVTRSSASPPGTAGAAGRQGCTPTPAPGVRGSICVMRMVGVGGSPVQWGHSSVRLSECVTGPGGSHVLSSDSLPERLNNNLFSRTEGFIALFLQPYKEINIHVFNQVKHCGIYYSKSV